MLLIEIEEAVDFEIQLAKLVLNRVWTHEYTSWEVVSGKSSATVGGIIKLTNKWLESEDRSALSNDIKHQIAHLIAGVSNEHNFNWQFIANKLYVKSDLIKLKAKEAKECRYCGKLTVLTSSCLCGQCKRISDAVRLNPDVAAIVMEEIGEL